MKEKFNKHKNLRTIFGKKQLSTLKTEWLGWQKSPRITASSGSHPYMRFDGGNEWVLRMFGIIVLLRRGYLNSFLMDKNPFQPKIAA